MDAFGASSLVAFALLLAFNQVVVKVVNDGLQPVFFAGVRSVGAAVLVALWIWARGGSLRIARRYWGAAAAMGTCFAVEFVCLFLALDLTTVTRSSIIFYTMPVWLALAAHFVLPGERISPQKALGLALAFGGAVTAIAFRSGGGQGSLLGDIFALGGALGWAGIALVARATRFNEVAPRVQHFYQLALSAPLLLLAAPLFGPFIRDLAPIHLWGVAFQVVVVAGFGFLFWIWIISIYPASSVAAFSFLSPIFGIFLGVVLLGETLAWPIVVAGLLVAVGLVLINLPARRSQVPQKV